MQGALALLAQPKEAAAVSTEGTSPEAATAEQPAATDQENDAVMDDDDWEEAAVAVEAQSIGDEPDENDKGKHDEWVEVRNRQKRKAAALRASKGKVQKAGK